MAFMFRYCILIMFFLCLFSGVPGQGIYNDERSGVEVLFPTGRNAFPHQWLYKRVHAEILPLCEDEQSRVEDILRGLFKIPC